MTHHSRRSGGSGNPAAFVTLPRRSLAGWLATRPLPATYEIDMSRLGRCRLARGRNRHRVANRCVCPRAASSAVTSRLRFAAGPLLALRRRAPPIPTLRVGRPATSGLRASASSTGVQDRHVARRPPTSTRNSLPIPTLRVGPLVRPSRRYILSIIAWPKPEHDTCFEPGISRAKS